MGGKGIMDYAKRQNENFDSLKKIVADKKTEKIDEAIKRLENTFAFYIIMDLNWENIITKAEELTGEDLEKLVSRVADIADSYRE